MHCLSGAAVLVNHSSFGECSACPIFAATKDTAISILLCGFFGLCADVVLRCLLRSESAESGETPIFNFNSYCQAALHRGRINLQCPGIATPPPPQHLILADFGLLLSGKGRRDQEETWYSKETLALSSMFQFVDNMYS